MFLLPSYALTNSRPIVCFSWPRAGAHAYILPIDLCVGAGDRRFQACAAVGEDIELGLDALLLDFQLPAARFAQLFRMRTTHACQTTLDVFRLEIFVKLL